MPWIPVARLEDLPDGRPIAVAVADQRLVVVRMGEQVFAMADRCSHRGFPLSDGVVAAGAITCRTHGACFDLATGAVLRGPARRPVRTYAVVVQDGEVRVEI